MSTRWTTILSSNVNLHHSIHYRAECGADLVTKNKRIWGQRNWRTSPYGWSPHTSMQTWLAFYSLRLRRTADLQISRSILHVLWYAHRYLLGNCWGAPPVVLWRLHRKLRRTRPRPFPRYPGKGRNELLGFGAFSLVGVEGFRSPQQTGCYATEFAPHKALNLIA